MENNKIEQIMNSAVDRIKTMIDSQTVIGEPIVSGKQTIVPLTKVSVGFVAGGGEYSADEKIIKQMQNYPFAGGTGAGACIQPIGFLVITADKIDLIKIDSKTPIEKIIDNIPKVTQIIAETIKEKSND